MNWKNKLALMVGKTYLRNGEETTILSFKEANGSVKIKTTGRDYDKHPDQMPAFLDIFLPLEGSQNESLPVAASVSAPSKLQKMQDALMLALDKVQEDADYIGQAEQVSKLVQTGINLAKLELDAIRLSTPR
ncbi:hypothetical protein [Hymenobacter sp. BT491]|uniref:hypothetical protein n=1 Tax=Hymenobacter sp. BT491 TaxID=2766779 RepID=UPI001653D03B|nr:hypothetical protein [Hymenobacter sp. BT491]MBC6988972.1 hypothetical protein [Hymenobacter sp. BT491]